MRAAHAARESNALVPRGAKRTSFYFADGQGQRQTRANAAPPERRARKINLDSVDVILGADGEPQPLAPLKNCMAAPLPAEAAAIPAAGALSKAASRSTGKRTLRITDPSPLAALVGQSDPKEIRARDKRLFLNHEREKRVTDPKVRVIGIDRQVLDRQLEERAEMRELEAATEDFWSKQAVQQDHHAVALDHEIAQARAGDERGVENYRRTYQKKHMAREWELNDPLALRKQLPARVGDDDPRCGPASMLRFEGEDLGYKARRKAQHAQVRLWRQQHHDEEAVLAGRDDLAERLADERNGELFDRLSKLEDLQRQQRNVAARSNAEFNRAFAAQKKRRREEDGRRDAAMSQAEIDHNLASALLNEYDTTRHGGRSKAKGLSAEEIAAIQNAQAQQRAQIRSDKIREAENAAIAAAREAQENKMAVQLDAQLNDERRAEQVHMCRQNETQRQMWRDKDLERRKLYATEVGEQYFANFSLVPHQ